MAVTLTVPNGERYEPRSQHLSDSAVQPFLQPDFDTADYLNSTLPSLSSSSRPSQGTQHARSVPLPEVSTQLQTLLNQLNAQTTRLSTTLNQLTNEIIRSGGRLAYEVEVLRGDTVGLTDTLENGLTKDIELFTPKSSSSAKQGATETDAVTEHEGTEGAAEEDSIGEPEYLQRLRTLNDVRTRLDTVIKTFGDAMAWPLAPSELSVASSLISVSAPESDVDSRGREEKGKEYAEKLRNDINDLIGSGNDLNGLEAAAAQVEELRRLAEVWKGTAEEKARAKLVDSLQKLVEDRQRALEKNGAQGRKSGVSPARAMDYRYGDLNAPSSARAANEGGYGFLQNLRNLKNEMYLE